jgi:hypothetical protein
LEFPAFEEEKISREVEIKLALVKLLLFAVENKLSEYKPDITPSLKILFVPETLTPYQLEEINLLALNKLPLASIPPA